jgi:hypothetical protein
MRYIHLYLIILLGLLTISCCKYHNNTYDNDVNNTHDTTITDGESTMVFDYKYVGFFLKTDKDNYFIADGDSLMFYDKQYIRIYPVDETWNPNAKKVTFDGLNSGDRIGIEIVTVGELDPAIMDIYKIEILEEGDISNIDKSVLEALNNLGYQIK